MILPPTPVNKALFQVTPPVCFACTLHLFLLTFRSGFAIVGIPRYRLIQDTKGGAVALQCRIRSPDHLGFLV
jgi:hypothetical protein